MDAESSRRIEEELQLFDQIKRQQVIGIAQQLVEEARKLDPREMLVFLASGQLQAATGSLEGAKADYLRAMGLENNGHKSIAPLLALSVVEYRMRNYGEALRGFERALREHPDCPPEVRLGIAACCYKLGSFDRCAMAYERVLEMDPGCTEALAGLAVLRFNLGGRQGKTEALELLARAAGTDAANPMVLCMLGGYSLVSLGGAGAADEDEEEGVIGGGGSDARRRLLDRIESLARAAMRCTQSDVVRSEAFYLQARASHARGDAARAAELYRLSVSLDREEALPWHPACRFALAQLLLGDKRAEEAVVQLERVLKMSPGHQEALGLLAYLYATGTGSGARARDLLDRTRADQLRSLEDLESIAEMAAIHDPRRSAQLYAMAIERSDRRAAEGRLASTSERGLRGVQLLNNAAVVSLRSGAAAEAESLVLRGLEAASATADSLPESVRSVVRFNAARILESRSQLGEARSRYQQILEDSPQSAECYVRLACLARRAGQPGEALEVVSRGLELVPGSSDLIAMRALLLLEARDWQEAKQAIDRLNKAAAGGVDPYGGLLLGNLNLYTAPKYEQRQQDPEAKKRFSSHVMHAEKAFRDVLERDSGNVFAVNGLGALMAEQGYYGHARDLFRMVSTRTTNCRLPEEPEPPCPHARLLLFHPPPPPLAQITEHVGAGGGLLQVPDVRVNLAAMYLAKGDTTTAINSYQQVLKQSEERDPAVLLYLARAQFDAERHEDAAASLQKYLHANPGDYAAEYDLALVLQDHAVRLVPQDKELLTSATGLRRLEQADRALARAHRLLQHLLSLPDPRRFDLSVTKMQGLSSICQQNRQRVDQERRKVSALLRDIQGKEEEARLKRQEMEQRRKDLEERARLEREAAAAQDRERLER